MFYFSKKSKNLKQVEKLFHRGDHEAALSKIQQLIAQYPNDEMLKLQNIWLKIELGQFEASEKDIEFGLSKDPDNALLLMLQGECFYQSKQFKASQASFLKSLEHEPDNLRSQYGLAKTYLAQSEFDKASELLEEIVKYNKVFVQSRLLMVAELQLMERQNFLAKSST